MNIEAEVFEHQKLFVLSNAKHTGLIGGYRSGKSHAGVLKAVIKKMAYPGIPVAYYLPTYGLIKDVAYGKFSASFDHFGIRYEINRSDKDILTPYGPVYLRSMDNPDSIIGYETGYALIDEVDILPTNKMVEIFSKVIARNSVRLPDGDVNCTDMVGTPEGFKFAYKFFVKEANNDRVIIRARTESNSDIADGYIDTLKDVYTPEQLRAYLNGEFVNLTSGTVYNTFDRHQHHTDESEKQGEVIHIGLDFNIMDMHAVAHVIRGGICYAVGEITKAYDTHSICQSIEERYHGHQVVVYPDAAGGSRNTSGKSDHQIVKEHGFKLRVGNKNPFVRDRVNAVNSAFMKGKYLVNTNNCPTLTEALENQAYDNNGEPDKKSGFDHITDAAGYFMHNQMGIQKPTKMTFSY